MSTKQRRRRVATPVRGFSAQEVKRVLDCGPEDEKEINEVRALMVNRRMTSYSAWSIYHAQVEEFRILAVRAMRDERDVYRVAKNCPDKKVRKEAIERLRFVVSLKRLLAHETDATLKARIAERYAWLTKRKAETHGARRAILAEPGSV